MLVLLIMLITMGSVMLISKIGGNSAIKKIRRMRCLDKLHDKDAGQDDKGI
ncbi:MAG: hypothetical protein MJZ51_07765 [Bacteroidales bacterium]|nr:hypothetical protein [Bacteroidales bacterium]